jgi:hypothetical protein
MYADSSDRMLKSFENQDYVHSTAQKDRHARQMMSANVLTAN